MTTVTVVARTARKPHPCEDCHWDASLRGTATIAAGHRYLIHTAYPGGEIETATPYRLKQCVRHAVATSRDHLTGACLSHCCGDNPCARPDRHDGDHSCHRCAPDHPHPAGVA